MAKPLRKKRARRELELSNLFVSVDCCPLCEAPRCDVIRSEDSALPSDPYFDSFRAPRIELRRCRACAFAFVGRLPADPEFYRRLYAHGLHWEEEVRYHGKGMIFSHARNVITHYRRGGRLLDIGAWVGGFLAAMSEDFEGTGVEIDADAARVARCRGFAVEGSPILEAKLPKNQFDVVSLIDVLEHLTDPAANLRRIKEWLKPGGVLYIKVPNYHAQMKKQDLRARLGLSNVGIMGAYVHINHFSRPSLVSCLTRLGFEVLETGFTPAEIYNLSRPAPPRVQLKRALVNAWRISGTLAASGASQLLRGEYGLNLYVIVKKPD